MRKRSSGWRRCLDFAGGELEFSIECGIKYRTGKDSEKEE
jgi:hypothetical protein